MTPSLPLTLSPSRGSRLHLALAATLAALLALCALPTAAQPPSEIACDTDVSNLIAGVTGSSGNGGNPNSIFFVDGSTGQTTLIAPTSVVPNHLAYDSEKQLMYYVDHTGQALYAYDVNSGATTLIDADIRSIPGNGDMPAGFTGHDAGTYWNGRYYIVPHNGTTGQTGDDLHWIEFDSTGLAIADSGLVQLSLPPGISHMGDFGDIVIDESGQLFGSSSSGAGNQLAGLFTADMNLGVPAVTVLNASYTGAQLALSGNDELYGNEWQTGVIARLDKSTGAVLSTVAVDFGGDFFDLAPVSPNDCDWGDLPDPPYATQATSSGPAHKTGVVTNVFLGSVVDAESDGQQSLDALGDGADEDAVRFLNPFFPGGATDIEVEASGSGVLNAWVDFNSDGDFNDAGEQIATDLAVVAGTNTLDDVAVPAGATGVSAARFRITVGTGQGGDSPTGSADNGEVEDYVLACIRGTVWNDLDGDGIQDGGTEVGVANVVATLVSPTAPYLPVFDGAGAMVTTTTDVNGDYEFCGLPTVGNSGQPNPGEYRVLFDRPAAFSDFSPANQGGDDTLDSDADQDTFGMGIEGLAPLQTDAPVSLTANQIDDTIDAGLRAVTAALITSAGAYVDGGSVVFEFSTGYEALTGGFEVMRFEPETGEYVAVTGGQVPALLGAPQGGVYRVADPLAPTHGNLRYVIVEHQTDGRTQAYGPYRVAVDHGAERAPLAAASAARPHRSQRALSRLRQAEREASRPASASSFRAPGERAAKADREGSRVLQIGVDASGLYRVSADEIAKLLGQPLSGVREMLSSGRVALRSGGRPVTWTPAGSAGDGLYFYGEAIDSLYTTTNVYQLELGAKGRLMRSERGAGLFTGGSRGTFQSTESYEQDRLAAINSTVETEIDHWYWDGINAASAETVRTFEIAVPDATGGSATLRSRLVGASNGLDSRNHQAVIRVNGVEIGTTSWSGMDRHEAVIDFNGSLLTPITTIEIEAMLPGDATGSIFYIDGFELDYERAYRAVEDRLVLTGDGNAQVTVDGFASGDVMVFDLGDPRAPSRLEGRTEPAAGGHQVSFRPGGRSTPYLAVSSAGVRTPRDLRPAVRSADLKARSHRYEHVVISPAAWQPAAEELAAHHLGLGRRSLAVSLEEIYDTFNHGVVSPWAIRDFLAYAREHWVEGPKYAVIAGRGTFDPRDLLGNGDNFAPAVLVGTPNGLISSDNVLADLEGGDSVPEVAIGRLPIVSAGELATYVAKLEGHGAAQGAWRERAVLTADNADAAGDFPAQSRAVSDRLGSYRQEAIDLGSMTVGDARAALIAAWNAGAGLINYVGHGGVTQAAAEGLLRTTDMDALSNGDRLPIVSALTCVLGRSDIPNVESLAEALVTDSDGGAIAVWAPTGVSISGAAHQLNLHYAELVDAAEPGTPLGDLVLQVLERFSAEGGVSMMLDTYGIVGDPAVALD